VIIAVIGWRRSCSNDARGGWLTLAFLVAAVVDYVFTLRFADGRVLTIY
jgi:hypothetical protein